jgi:4-amino-4-deoxy-L-arabinose transferase-like glycosyltransferase
VGNEIQEAFIHGDHPGNPFYYVYKLPLLLLPWGLLLPVAIWFTLQHTREESGSRFLLCWWVTSWLLLTLIPNKQEHYALLLLPPSALLIGYYLVSAWSSPGRHRAFVKGYVSTLLLILILSGTGLVFVPYYTSHHWSPAAAGIGAGMCIIGATGWKLRRNSRPWAGMLSIALMTALAGSVYAYVLHDHHDPQSLIPVFTRQAASYIADAPHAFVQGSRSEAIEFYAGRPLTEMQDVHAIWQHAQPGDILILSSKKYRPLPGEPLPAKPVIDIQRQGARCVLLAK